MISDTHGPINGEILTGETGMDARPASGSLEMAVDAEFETVAPAQPLFGARPSAVMHNPGPASSAPPGDCDALTDTLAVLRLQAGGSAGARSSLRSVLYGAAAVLALAALWLSVGQTLVTPVTPKSEFAAPLSDGIRIAGLDTRLETLPDGGRVVLVNGSVVNEGASAAAVPPVTIRITAKDGITRRYTFGTRNGILGAGENTGFAYRLDAPGAGVKNVAVGFRMQR